MPIEQKQQQKNIDLEKDDVFSKISLVNFTTYFNKLHYNVNFPYGEKNIESQEEDEKNAQIELNKTKLKKQ